MFVRRILYILFHQLTTKGYRPTFLFHVQPFIDMVYLTIAKIFCGSVTWFCYVILGLETCQIILLIFQESLVINLLRATELFNFMPLLFLYEEKNTWQNVTEPQMTFGKHLSQQALFHALIYQHIGPYLLEELVILKKRAVFLNSIP